MARKTLETPSAPPAIGPYTVAVEAAGLVFLSGQVALIPEGGREDGDVSAQTRQVMNNIGAMLGDIGLGYSDIAKATIFMVDIGEYAAINEVYAEYFEGDAPARSAVEVSALPGGFRVEIEIVAARSGHQA
ncbi:MAG: hypothetical protein F4Y40_08300 [Acidimicrobiia bacterium]|nr:hypothetical protein [Acidimicrobiia bacterium]MYF82891.1 hypothetical protein [Acidimicrobiia bacterium]